MREYRVQVNVRLREPLRVIDEDAKLVGYVRNYLVRARTPDDAVRVATADVADGVIDSNDVHVEDSGESGERGPEQVLGRSGRILYPG